jgi:hypothetical protein
MRNLVKSVPYSNTVDEKKSIKFLMEKMGISKKEIEELMSISGVSASKMIELMQLSKYQYVVNEAELVGRCAPCKPGPKRFGLTRFA